MLSRKKTFYMIHNLLFMVIFLQFMACPLAESCTTHPHAHRTQLAHKHQRARDATRHARRSATPSQTLCVHHFFVPP